MGTARMARPTYEQLLDIIAAEDRQIAQLPTHNRQLETRVRQLVETAIEY